jgi:ADP-ribosyl-[dinitrogen reductase] hydrolase
MSVPTPLDRVRGSFLGLAIGDALGAPLEGLSPQQIRVHYQVVTDYVDGMKAWKKKPFRWRLPGLYTDDTQQALALTDVLLGAGEIDLDRLTEVYLSLASPDLGHAGAHRGVGKSFRSVLADLKRGVSPRETGQASVGIGAAMRIAPVGLYFADDPDALFDAVMTASLMTHRDVRSLSGAMAVAFGVARLLNLEDARPDPSFIFRLAGDVAKAEERIAVEFAGSVNSLESHGKSLSAAIAHVESLLELPRDRAIAALLEQANRHGPDSCVRRATQGFPPSCIPTCLYLLLTTESIEEALIDVVNLGGDADSAGAILGSFAGAVFGKSTIPNRWLKGLQNSEAIDLRAQAIHRKSACGMVIPDLVSREFELSALEQANRESLLSQPPTGGDLGANQRI